MNNTVRSHLRKALNALEENPFEDFKWTLKCINHNGKENIPISSLEKATRLEVVDLLIQYYKEDAVDVCIIVLQQSNINNVARNLEEALQGKKIQCIYWITNCLQ
ncbi:hypothetical protein NXF25_001344 [Crotalus adamanteus]|uniref:Pyrin domain-containing protein n=1 Tax=Crotalus adamanteus TaxID=8729 RepID=A0AAW1C6W9_CROAD